MLSEPFLIPPLGMLSDLAKELNRLGLVARLGRVVRRDHHLDLDRDHVPVRLD
jgi:hypothetical protein